MKTLKTLSLGLAAAAAFAGTSAHAAPTIVRIAGSTAFRAPATAAIIDYLSAGGTVNCFAGYDKSSSNLLGSAGAILANGTIKADGSGTATVIVETYWTGSLAGLVDLVAGNNVGNYIDPTTMNATDLANFNISSAVSVGSATNSSAYAFPNGGIKFTTTDVKPGQVANALSSYPQLTMSDSNQATVQTELATATLTGTITGDLNTYTKISQLAAAVGNSSNVMEAGDSNNAGDATGNNANGDGLVGVVPFVICRGNGSPTLGGTTANPTTDSISEQALKTIIGGGKVDSALLTGVSGSGSFFYLTGRNEDSGTRIDTFSESQFGVKTAPVQYNASFTLYPANSTLNTEPQISWAPAGHSGDASGGTVAANLGAAESNGKFLIGYLGITDAFTGAGGAVTLGATALKYNGIPYSTANIQNGLYTLWGYEYSYALASTLNNTTPPAGATVAISTVVNAIADNIHNGDSDVSSVDGTHAQVSGGNAFAAGVVFDTMKVTRPATPEGGPITHN